MSFLVSYLLLERALIVSNPTTSVTFHFSFNEICVFATTLQLFETIFDQQFT